jgi:hypothetical protein
MDALRRSIAIDSAASAPKKPKKRRPARKMLLPISGQGKAKDKVAANKP